LRLIVFIATAFSANKSTAKKQKKKFFVLKITDNKVFRKFSAGLAKETEPRK